MHEARRFLSNKSENIATENVLVTIYGTNLPQHIKLWLTRQEILFIDKPRQCRKCFSFSHPTSKCKNESICENCGEQHNIQSCTSPSLTCILCKSPHKATGLKYPKREEERKFLKFKCLNRLSFIDARRKFQIYKKSYSSVTLTSHNDHAHDKTHYVTKEELTEILNRQMLEQRILSMEMINSQALLLQQTMDKYNEHIMKNLSCISLAIKNITEETLNKNLNENEVKRPPKSKKN
ncbi:hypothetical protein AVEN_108392-1 [Araneus ventricosus]|uniref:Pre-C2HC domain-containing protein n=1 Tax=Araneus ventricosus TaxID=182803 RepID=A0A4Y2CV84_ARAVE|nr:hypothetical protein AVEN_108392-1 [Araneus ventricosus]